MHDTLNCYKCVTLFIQMCDTLCTIAKNSAKAGGPKTWRPNRFGSITLGHMKKNLNNETVVAAEVNKNIEEVDCEFCRYGGDDHRCNALGLHVVCHAEMSEETCTKFKGYCSEECRIFGEVEFPRILQEKKAAGMYCCDYYDCTKCLLVRCDYDNCPTHSQFAKRARRAYFRAEGRMEWLSNKAFSEIGRAS